MMGLANVGDILAGKYRVERILGIGGMGMVVLATHLELEQSVAIKFMLPAALESPEAGARFMREARAAGRLTSEHVCRVSDVGRFESGVPYIVMEYLEGHDLGTLLKRKGPFKVASAVDYIIQAAEGMAEAHGHGIVHRDLKPDNLFLHRRTDGNQIVKVLDFGISKASVTGIATKTGDIMGSPAYMAPEQMQSTRDVDARADIWSLGVILYQLVSGRMPFISDTLPGLCLAVMNDAPPSLDSVRKDLPHGLAQVVMKCLAKQRDERYRNVHELAVALAPYGKPESASAITRIRSMLQRKRPPTPPPLMMLPSEFSDLSPTLVGDEPELDPGASCSAPVIEVVAPRTPLPASLTETTLGSGSAESLSLAAPRMNRGVVGALAGAIALVALIIVMVLINRDNRPEAAAASSASPPPPSTTRVEPIEEPAPPPPPPPAEIEQVVGEESAPVIETEAESDRDHRRRERRRRRAKEAAKQAAKQAAKETAKETAKENAKETAKETAPVASGSAAAAGSGSAATPEEDDPWGHMQHDGRRFGDP